MYGTLEDSVEHVVTLHRRQWLSGEQSDVLVILIIIALPLVSGQHELCHQECYCEASGGKTDGEADKVHVGH
jgi:hypothetical protein